jgi:hypothetical protein
MCATHHASHDWLSSPLHCRPSKVQALQVPHPLLRKPHSILGATVSPSSASKVGIQLPALPQRALLTRPAQVASASAEAGKQPSGDKKEAAASVRASPLPAEHAVGVPVPRSILSSHPLPLFPAAQLGDQPADRQQAASVEADTAQPQPVGNTVADSGTPAVAPSHRVSEPNCTWETLVIDMRDTRGAEAWGGCSARSPPTEVMLSRLREHACCEDLGVDPVHPFTQDPEPEGTPVGHFHGRASHGAVLLSVARASCPPEQPTKEVGNYFVCSSFIRDCCVSGFHAASIVL